MIKVLCRDLLVIVLGGCLFDQAAAQDTFNHRFDTFDQLRVQDGWAVELAADSGFLAIHMSYYLQEPYLYLLTAVSRLSATGEHIATDHSPLAMHTSYCGWANSSDKTMDGRIVVGGNTLHPGDVRYPSFTFFDEGGMFLDQWEFAVGPYAWLGRQAKQTPDGGFVLCGETTSTGYVDGFLLKTDANGVLEWVRTYGFPDLRDLIISVDLAPDGGYYLGGKREPTFNSFDPWVLRVDASGELIWDETYGSPYDDGPNAHLTTMADGMPVFAGGLATGPQARFVPCLIKLDDNGDVLWESFFGVAIVNTTLFAVKEIEEGGDLIAVGQHNLSNLSAEAFMSGMLVRTTSTGDSLWMRFYQYHDDQVATGRGRFRDVLPTPDGGFVAVGTALPNGVHDQDLWVVKVDGHGCLEPGCHIITGMEVQITNLRDALHVWPNPLPRGMPLQVEMRLPEGFTAQGALRITVTDGAGRLVHEQDLNTDGHPERSEGISTVLFPTFSFGLYHIHLHDNTRWIAGAKVVVE